MKLRLVHRGLCVAVIALMLACGGGREGEECVYPVGELRFAADQLVFDTVVLGEDAERSVRVYNPTDSPVLLEQSGRLAGFRLYYNGEEMAFGGVEIPAKECGVLRVVFHPDLDTLLGNYFDRLRFFVDGQGGFGEGVYVKAYVRDGFEGKVGNASPVLRMEKRDFDFGWVSAGDTVTVDFLLKNAGSNGLLIRKIETSCGCTVVEMDDRLVLPGQERRVRIKFDTQNLLGFQRKRIVLYTNDPKAGVVTLTLRGDVRK